jgi:hypothetical protein
MTFLGRKLRGSFEGEIVSDLSDFSGRIPGCRIKHRVSIRERLARTPLLKDCPNNSKRATAKITRIFRRFRAHGLIAKVPHSRR